MGATPRSEDTTPRRPGRPRGSVNANRDTTRGRILDVATELFAADGFHATSVADVAAGSNLQVGALYYHIKSKQYLLWEILRRYTEKALRAAKSVVASEGNAVDKLGKLIAVHVEIVTQHRREVTIQMRDADALNAEHAVELQALRQAVQDCWEQVLDEGYRAGMFTCGDRVVVNGLLGMLNSVAYWYRPERGDTPEHIARELRAMVIGGLAQ